MADAGAGRDPRLAGAIDWIIAQQDERGRWHNRYTYQGKLWADIERTGDVSKWVTLRACRVVRAALGD